MKAAIIALDRFANVAYWGIPATVGGLALWRGHIVEALMMGAFGYAQGKGVFFLKHTFPRARPQLLGSTEDYESFPSSHSAAASLGAITAVCIFKEEKLFVETMMCLALLVALSRYLSHRHYFSDVMVGLLIGGSVAFLAHKTALYILIFFS